MSFRHFSTVNRYKCTLMASLDQSSIDSPFQGQQCTAIGIMAMAMDTTKPIEMWDSKLFNNILHAGDKLHSTIRSIGIGDGFLTVDDFNNFPIKPENSLTSVYVKVTGHDILSELQGVLSSVIDLCPGSGTLEGCLDKLISSGFKYAVIVTKGYSYSVIVDQKSVFFIDSHKRNADGYINADGKAVILCMAKVLASFEISRLIHLNHDSKQHLNGKNLQDLMSHSFQIVPVEFVTETETEADASVTDQTAPGGESPEVEEETTENPEITNAQ